MSVTATAGEAEALAEPRARCEAWLAELDSGLRAGDLDRVLGLFDADCWLVDRLALTWELRTFRGREALRPLFADRLARSGLGGLVLDPAIEPARVAQGGREWVEASFRFTTAVGNGRGFVRLVEVAGSALPLAWTFVLELRELSGFEEPRGPRRPLGVEHGSTRTAETWLDRRARTEAFADRDPEVVVVGAGQCGLSLAARLGQLGVSTLVLERQPRVGDPWRQRYRSLVLHDSVWGNHLPYLEFPETWPRFIPKDKLADWFEAYASIMELNVWTGAEIEACRPNDDGSWSLTVGRKGAEPRTLVVSHLVFATGLSGLPRVPAIAGAETFAGRMLHSSEYTSADGMAGRRALVVGSGNSGHDISHDLAEAGAEVTMLQRSRAFVMSSRNGLEAYEAGIYEEGQVLDDADHVAGSLPLPLAFEFERTEIAPALRDRDAELLAGLRRAGFQLDEEHGLIELFLRRGGGYYIDVGASAAIIDGRIEVRSGLELDHFTPTGAVFTDGSDQELDVVVFATGYSGMLDVARAVVGDEVADRCQPVWGVDDAGDLSSVWGPSGVNGLWFAAGNLGMARVFSLLLGLQIKAVEEARSIAERR